MKGKNILILDDDSTYRESLKKAFEQHEYEVFTAEHAEQALAIAEQEKPTMILSDVVMFPIDGIMFLKKLRLLGSYGTHVPCFLYTHVKKESLQQEIKHLSIIESYNKEEVSPEELYSLLSAYTH
jgi:CheY-like chemotaxis protein